MKIQSKVPDQILPLELGITLVGTVLGVGILTLPRSLVQQVGTADGWISIILGGLIAMFIATLYMRLNRHFPDQNLLQFLANGRIGKWLAKLLGFLFIIYFMLILAFEARVLSTVVNIYLLVNTPAEVILAIMFLVVAYAVTKGIQGIIHLNLLFVPICTFALIGIIVFNFKEFDIHKLLPIMPTGISPVVLGVKKSLVSFLGIEILFFLLVYMKASKMKARTVNKSLGFVTFIYLLVTVLCYSTFTFESTEVIAFPTVELVKEIELPGGFFERLESIVITVWIMTIFNTMSIILFLLNDSVKSLFFKKTKMIWMIATIIPLVYLLAFIPQSINEAFLFGERVGFYGLFLIILSVVAGYLILWHRKRKASKQKEEERANS